MKKKNTPDQNERTHNVSRKPTRLFQLSVNHVIEFQGFPVKVRNVTNAGNGLVRMTLSRDLDRPDSDERVKVGRYKVDPYEKWTFDTREIAGSISVDRFIPRPVKAPE